MRVIIFLTVLLFSTSVYANPVKEVKDYIKKRYSQIAANQDINLDKTQEMRDVLHEAKQIAEILKSQKAIDYLCKEYKYDCEED